MRRSVSSTSALLTSQTGMWPMCGSTCRLRLDIHSWACPGWRQPGFLPFRDWAAEETNHPREVVEAALAHVVQNQVEAAYARSDLFERRRKLMEEWSAAVCRHTASAGMHDRRKPT